MKGRMRFLFLFVIIHFQESNCCKKSLSRNHRSKRLSLVKNGRKAWHWRSGRTAGLFCETCAFKSFNMKSIQSFLTEDFSPQGSSECLREVGFDYSGGRESNIFDWTGVSQEHCERLAASTPGGRFWTYRPSESRCWVKKTNKGRKANSGVVSGNRACGQPLPGKISDFA